MESYQRSVEEWVLYEVVLSLVIRIGYRVPLLSNPWIWVAAALAIALQGLLNSVRCCGLEPCLRWPPWVTKN